MPRYSTAGRFAVLTIALVSLVACAPTDVTTPSNLTRSEHSALVDYALTLINDARSNTNLNKLTLDTNPAAQSHAEQSRSHCTRGHWGPDGMKPYMRYTLAGGEQYSAENVFAIDFCPERPGYNTSLRIDHQRKSTSRWTFFSNGPGHRQNILNPHHRNVGIGISYRRPTIWFVQLFVGDYIEYETKPNDRLRDADPQRSSQKRRRYLWQASPSVIIYYDPTNRNH